MELSSASAQRPLPDLKTEQRLRRDMRVIGMLFVVLWFVVFFSPDLPVFPERSGFLLQFHFLVEGFSIIVSVMVAALASRWLSRDQSGLALLLWAGFAVVAVFDTLHVLAWDGMPAGIVPVGPDHAIYFWLLARCVLAVVLLMLALNVGLQLSRRTILAATLTIVIVGTALAFLNRDGWPSLYQPGRGVTAVKAAIEVIIAMTYASAAVLFWRDSRPDSFYRHLPIATACFVLALGEMLFSYYVVPSALSNMVGHLYKVVGYYLIYRAVVVEGLERPFKALESASAALQESGSQLRALADNLPNGLVYVFTRDADGTPRFRHISRGVQQVHGVSPEQVMADAMVLFRQIHKDDVARLLAAEEESRRTLKPVQVQARFRHPSGQWRVMQYASQPRLDQEGQVIWEGLEMDISELVRTREQLELQHVRLQSIIDSAMDGTLSLDSQHRIVIVNQAAERLFQRKAQDLIGKPLDILIPERFRRNHAGHMRRFQQHGDSARSMGEFGRIYGLRADGSEFPIEASIARIGEGENALFTVVLRDITSKLDSEQRRQRLETQLQQSQKMEALGTLAGGIAHDFNNILAIINGNADLAATDLPPDHSASLALKEISLAGQRGRDLIQRILTFSRLRQHNPEVLDVANVVEESRQLLRPTLPAGVQLSLEIGEGPFTVSVDRIALEQVLINLCTNAWQAMPPHGGHIWIRLRRAPWLGAEPCPHAVVLEVSDDGAGIAADIRDRIFDPFFTTKPVGQGTGLGLAMVHSIITRSGGRIDVASEPGLGTTFTITLPASFEEAAASGPARPAVADHSPLHLLYVDDEQALVFLMQRGLGRRGHQVTCFTDPREALAACNAGTLDYDVALLDHNMPHLSGLELASALLKRHPERKVILTSGYVDSHLEEAAAERGITSVVYKPASVEDMLGMILETVKSRAADAPTAEQPAPGISTI